MKSSRSWKLINNLSGDFFKIPPIIWILKENARKSWKDLTEKFGVELAGKSGMGYNEVEKRYLSRGT